MSKQTKIKQTKMWTIVFLDALGRLATFVFTLLAIIAAILAIIAHVRRNRRVTLVAASACGVIGAAFFLVWLQGFLYDHQSEEQQAQSIANLPSQARIEEVNRGDWNDGDIVFTLPQTRPVPVWMAAIWRMNSLKSIDLTANSWAGKQEDLDNSVTLTYDPKTMEYTYDSEANL